MIWQVAISMRGIKMNHNEHDYDQDAEAALIQSTHDLTALKQRYTAFGVAQHLISLMHLISSLQYSTGDLFKVSDINDESVSPEWTGRIICTYPADHKNKLLYNSLLDHLTFWSQSVVDEFPMHEFNPYFRYFLNEANQCGFCFSPFDDFDFIFYRCEERTDWMCAKLNKFVNSIRKIGENIVVAAEMKKFQRASDDNYRSGMNYVETLFDKYSRLMVVRVDLAYRKHHLVSDPLQEYVPEHYVTSEDEFLMHRQKLLEGLQRHPIFEHLRGYMIKLEHGREKGFHCHCLFMFNGSKVRQGISLGQMIGGYWVNEITDNKGLFYNCNLYPHYFYDGLGMVDRDDTKKLTGIEYAVKYMTKPDAIVRLSLGNTRIFTRGVMPEIPDVRLGRPRAV
jgi:hypothetical protein